MEVESDDDEVVHVAQPREIATLDDLKNAIDLRVNAIRERFRRRRQVLKTKYTTELGQLCHVEEQQVRAVYESLGSQLHSGRACPMM